MMVDKNIFNVLHFDIAKIFRMSTYQIVFVLFDSIKI